jgi:hypothetical protein
LALDGSVGCQFVFYICMANFLLEGVATLNAKKKNGKGKNE